MNMGFREYHSFLKNWTFWNFFVMFCQIWSCDIRKVDRLIFDLFGCFLFSRDSVRFYFFYDWLLFGLSRRLNNSGLFDWLRYLNFWFLFRNLFRLNDFLLWRWFCNICFSRLIIFLLRRWFRNMYFFRLGNYLTIRWF